MHEEIRNQTTNENWATWSAPFSKYLYSALPITQSIGGCGCVGGDAIL